jgi:glucosamine-6-phosphate deaminase
MDYYRIDEETVLSNGKIKVFAVDTKIDIYNEIARLMVDRLKENNERGLPTSFIIPVGPDGQYQRFVSICNRDGISCKNLVTINMDEYLDDDSNYIPMDHDLSFRGFMKKNLFDALNDNLKIKKENIYFPDPKNTGELLKVITELNGVDICFGGIGINGHIAFNEPMDPNEISVEEFKEKTTRVLDIKTETRVVNCLERGGHIEYFPNKCISIGMKEIFMSKELRFYVYEEYESAEIRKAIFMDPTPAYPATYLKTHRNSSLTVPKCALKQWIK